MVALFLFSIFFVSLGAHDNWVHVYYNAFPSSDKNNYSTLRYSLNPSTEVGINVVPIKPLMRVVEDSYLSSSAGHESAIHHVEQLSDNYAILYTTNQCHQIKLMDCQMLQNQSALFQNVFNEQYIQQFEKETIVELRQVALQKSATLEEQHLNLTVQSKNFLKSISLKADRFTFIVGNEAQRLLHQELVTIIEATAALEKQVCLVGLEKECCFVAFLADLGMDAAWNGDLVLGFQISDICSTILSSLQNISSSVLQAITVVKDYCVENPSQLASVALIRICPKVSLALQLAPIVKWFLQSTGRVIAISHHYLFNDQASAKEEFYAFIDPFIQMQKFLEQSWYQWTWQEIKSWFLPVTIFATRTVVEYKLNSYLSKIFKHAEKAAWDIFKKGFKSAYVKTALKPCAISATVAEKQGKGVFQRVKDANLSKNKKARNSLGGKKLDNHTERYKLPRADNLDKFFELPFGNKLKNKSKSIMVYKGNKPIKAYRVQENYGPLIKGDIYYLDTMHKDHLEVYSQYGRAKGVINLDGSWNDTKSNNVFGRTISL